jgi:hypothetical protein
MTFDWFFNPFSVPSVISVVNNLLKACSTTEVTEALRYTEEKGNMIKIRSWDQYLHYVTFIALNFLCPLLLYLIGRLITCNCFLPITSDLLLPTSDL